MASFLTTFEKVGVEVGKVALSVAGTAGPAAATAFGGPVAGAFVTSLVAAVVQAEKNHVAAGSPPTPTGSVDPRMTAVIQNVTAFMPVIELAAAAFGKPIGDKAVFEAAVPQAIDAIVLGFNSMSQILLSFGVKS